MKPVSLRIIVAGNLGLPLTAVRRSYALTTGMAGGGEMVDTPKKPNPLGLMDDEDRDESIINDIFVTDKDWEDWEKLKKESEARRAAQAAQAD